MKKKHFLSAFEMACFVRQKKSSFFAREDEDGGAEQLGRKGLLNVYKIAPGDKLTIAPFSEIQLRIELR